MTVLAVFGLAAALLGWRATEWLIDRIAGGGE